MTAYHRPDTLDEALRIAADGACILAAGCTDLFPATSAQALTGPVLDLTGIAALKGITRSAAGWRIGAGTSWAEIARADLPEAFAGLQQQDVRLRTNRSHKPDQVEVEARQLQREMR